MKTKLTLFFLFFITLPFLHSQTIKLNFPSVNGQVYTVAVEGNTLYIAGDFIEVEKRILLPEFTTLYFDRKMGQS